MQWRRLLVAAGHRGDVAVIRELAAISLVLAAAAPARADKAAADAAFEEAKRLSAAGNLAEACPKFEVSYNEDPQVGSLLNLADCHERIGKLATARAEFHSAIELAHRRNDTREAYASQRASKLDPLVAHVVMHARAGIAGLRVRLDERDVTAMIESELPIDAGHHVIATTSSTGTWSSDLSIERDGVRTELTVPNGDETPLPAPLDVNLANRRGEQLDEISATRHTRHVLAITIGSTGLAAVAGGLVFGGLAIRDVHKATRSGGGCTLTQGTNAYTCNADGNSLLDSASNYATASDVLVGVGAAAVAAAAIVWFTAPSERMSVTPMASSTAAGVTMTIKF